MQFEHTFNFRKVSATALENMLADLDQKIDVNEFFDVVNTDKDDKPTHFRRKAETHTLEAPDWVKDIPELAQRWILNEITNFVKTLYVDNFLPVGEHDWATIEKEAATSRGTGRISISDDLLHLAAANFGQYIASSTGHEKVGELLAATAKAKFSQAAITKNLNECTPELIDKLQARVDGWAEWLSESGHEDAEELADAYNFFTIRLTKVKDKLTTSTADIIRDVL